MGKSIQRQTDHMLTAAKNTDPDKDLEEIKKEILEPLENRKDTPRFLPRSMVLRILTLGQLKMPRLKFRNIFKKHASNHKDDNTDKNILYQLIINSKLITDVNNKTYENSTLYKILKGFEDNKLIILFNFFGKKKKDNTYNDGTDKIFDYLEGAENQYVDNNSTKIANHIHKIILEQLKQKKNKHIHWLFILMIIFMCLTIYYIFFYTLS